MEKGNKLATYAVIGFLLIITSFWIIQVIEVVTGVNILSPQFTIIIMLFQTVFQEIDQPSRIWRPAPRRPSCLHFQPSQPSRYSCWIICFWQSPSWWFQIHHLQR